jgi:hypothetical protein
MTEAGRGRISELPDPAHFQEVAFEVPQLRVGFADLAGKRDWGLNPYTVVAYRQGIPITALGETVRPQPTDDLSDFQAVGSVTFAVTVCLSRQQSIAEYELVFVDGQMKVLQ